jgi:hypothetical protein
MEVLIAIPVGIRNLDFVIILPLGVHSRRR